MSHCKLDFDCNKLMSIMEKLCSFDSVEVALESTNRHVYKKGQIQCTLGFTRLPESRAGRQGALIKNTN